MSQDRVDETPAATPIAGTGSTEHASRHVSMRLPGELYQRLEALAADNGESVSQTARRLLSDGLESPDHQAIDRAISTLQLVRRQLGHGDESAERPARTVPPEPARVPRTVDLFNAKTDLQHLIDDVARGDEIVITYAGARRARLVSVDPSSDRPPPSRRPPRNR